MKRNIRCDCPGDVYQRGLTWAVCRHPEGQKQVLQGLSLRASGAANALSKEPPLG